MSAQLGDGTTVNIYERKRTRCYECGKATVRSRTFKDARRAGETSYDTEVRLVADADAWKRADEVFVCRGCRR